MENVYWETIKLFEFEFEFEYSWFYPPVNEIWHERMMKDFNENAPIAMKKWPTWFYVDYHHYLCFAEYDNTDRGFPSVLVYK